MLSKSITKLVQYGMETGLVPECEKITLSIFFWMYFMKMNMWNRKRAFQM